MNHRLLLGVLLLALCPAPRAAGGDEPTRRVIGRAFVRGEGHVRVAGAALRAMGAADLTRVAVERHARPVPVLADGDDLVFLAVDTQGRHTATAAYEFVHLDAAAPRTIRLDLDGTRPAPTNTALICRQRDAEDRVHGAVSGGRTAIYRPDAPTWFLLRLEHQGQVRRTLDARSRQGDQTLRVHVHGTYLGPIALAAVWGPADLGLAKAENAVGGTTLSWQVPGASVPSGALPLVLTNRSPPLPEAPKNDLSPDRGRLWIDAIELDGSRRLVRRDRFCRARIAGERDVWIHPPPTGADAKRKASVWILDAAGQVLGAGVAFPVLPSGPEPVARADLAALPGAATCLLCRRVLGVRVEHVIAGPSPLTVVGAARHVIIATAALLPDARRLAAHRTRHGLPSAAVNVADIYATHGHGEQTPQAIRAFVAALQQRPVPLEYLLLAGDAIHDRTDWSARATIPAPTVRTLWNGATPSDGLYVGDDGTGPGHLASVGRLPFRRAAPMARYVDRLIDHETQPPVHAHRRLLRFLAGRSGMGKLLDLAFERAFRLVLEQSLDPAFEIDVTYANPTSPYYWPLQGINAKVVTDVNGGCLVYTFVGHGTSHEREVRAAWDADMGIFTRNDVRVVDIRGPLPLILALASSSAAFDLLKRQGLGEALLHRPRGPLAYWGATRYCNPVYNVLIARGLARHMGIASRVGDVLAGARAELYSRQGDFWHNVVMGQAKQLWPDVPEQALLREGAATYALLGDPALVFARPKDDLVVGAEAEAEQVTVDVRSGGSGGGLPDGTTVHVQLVRRRTDFQAEPKPVKDPDDPKLFDAVCAVHRRANDRVVVEATFRAQKGGGQVTLALPVGRVPAGLRVVVFAITKHEVHHGSLVLK